VVVQVNDRWYRGWLIGREHEETGWTGTVQYEDDEGVERTKRLPAERIALPESDRPTERAS
jgi:hypothetical protein